MRLYLVQHGDSLPKDVDPARPLSDTGRTDVQRLASFLRDRVRVSRVRHSGKTRAQQTAELLAAAIAPGMEVETLVGIEPLDPVDPIARQMVTWTADTLVVGHLPFMGKLVARLITGSEETGVVSFQPGSVACLERGDDGRFVLLWMLRSELLGA